MIENKALELARSIVEEKIEADAYHITYKAILRGIKTIDARLDELGGMSTEICDFIGDALLKCNEESAAEVLSETFPDTKTLILSMLLECSNLIKDIEQQRKLQEKKEIIRLSDIKDIIITRAMFRHVANILKEKGNLTDVEPV